MTGGAANASMRSDRDLVRIYRTHLLQRVLLAIIVPVIILVLAAAIGLVLLNNVGPLPVSKIAGTIVLGGVALVLLWLLAVGLTYKVTLTGDAIAVSHSGWVRVLRRSEIVGRRETRGNRNRRWVALIPTDPRAGPLRLPADLATDASFEAWIAGLCDLNAEDLGASEAEIARDPSYGATPQERLRRLARTRTAMKWVNTAAIAVAVWCIIAPWPYLAAVGAAAILPAVAVIAVAASGGLVRFVRTPTQAHAAAGSIPVFCTGALALRAHWDIYLVDWAPALKIGGGAGLVLLTLALLMDRSLTQRGFVLGLAAVTAVAYGIAALMLTDVHFDRSAGQDFQSRILNARVSRGKATSYFVKLAPWGPVQSADEFLVAQTMFNRLMPGTTVCPRMHDGAFGIRWFTIEYCAPGTSNTTSPFKRFDQIMPGTNPFGPPPGNQTFTYPR